MQLVNGKPQQMTSAQASALKPDQLNTSDTRPFLFGPQSVHHHHDHRIRCTSITEAPSILPFMSYKILQFHTLWDRFPVGTPYKMYGAPTYYFTRSHDLAKYCYRSTIFAEFFIHDLTFSIFSLMVMLNGALEIITII